MAVNMCASCRQLRGPVVASCNADALQHWHSACLYHAKQQQSLQRFTPVEMAVSRAQLLHASRAAVVHCACMFQHSLLLAEITLSSITLTLRE